MGLASPGVREEDRRWKRSGPRKTPRGSPRSCLHSRSPASQMPKGHGASGCVEQFALFLKGKPLPASTREDVESFTASLRSAPGAEEWKVQKASDPLRLLLTAVFGKRWGKFAAAPAGNTVDPSLDPLRAACRARGYSRRTEESYAQWVRRFEDFRRTRFVGVSDAHAVSAFLERCAKARAGRIG